MHLRVCIAQAHTLRIHEHKHAHMYMHTHSRAATYRANLNFRQTFPIRSRRAYIAPYAAPRQSASRTGDPDGTAREIELQIWKGIPIRQTHTETRAALFPNVCE